jgi:hypothetical protein
MSNIATIMGMAVNNPGPSVGSLYSTTLYTGTGAARTITNGLNLSAEGGLVWTKPRESASFTSHFLVDTARGGNKTLNSNANSAEVTQNYISSFNTDGFTYANSTRNGESGIDYVSWAWRKSRKFFDVVTWSGNGVSTGRTISHNLDAAVGMLVIKNLGFTQDWQVWHRSSTPGNMLKLNLVNGESGSNEAVLGNGSSFIAPTSTEFTVGVGINNSLYNYVAYLFAHNDGDGGFGPGGDQDIIKCGSYKGNGSASGPEIDLGFTPQFIMVKNTDGTDNWIVADTARGIVTGGIDPVLYWNNNLAELSAINYFQLTSTGFSVVSSRDEVNRVNHDFVYIAIREE